jgi:TonB family protein
VRWDSPFVLGFAGTLAIHTIIVVAIDAIVVTHPLHPDPPPPKVELFDIKYEPPPPPPPPELALAPTPAPTLPAPVVHARVASAAPKAETPAPPVIAPLASPDPGNAPVLAMEDIAPSATGVPAARGKRTTGSIGGGGTGSGTGSGSGSGSGEVPMSVATIKTRALPRGDFSYYDLGRDYPTEAKQLGIEGDIRVKLVVDEHGKVASRTLLNHLGHGLDELAMTRAAAIEFTPARDTEDRPVSSVVVWTFHMTLPK